MKNTYILDESSGIKKIHELAKFVYSTKEKGAHDNAILKMVTDIIANQTREEKEQRRMYENMNIHMGRWMDIKSDGLIRISLEGDKSVSYGREKVRNYPYMDVITQSIGNDFKNKPKKESIIDWSKNAMITRKERQRSIIKNKLQEIFVAPEIARATQHVDAQYGDPLALNEQQLSQRQQDIDNIVANSLSEEVKNLIENDKLPTEELIVKIKDIAYKRSNMEYNYSQGIDFMITCGEEAYRKEMGFKEVYMRPISIPDLAYDLSYHSNFFEDALWANETIYLSPMEVVQKAYHVFKNKDWKEIERLFTAIPNSQLNGTGADMVISRMGMSGLSNIDQSRSYTVPIRGGQVDHATQEFVPSMMDGRNGVLWTSAFMNKMGNDFTKRKLGIPVNYCTWRWNVPAHLVTRVVNGREVQFIRGEHYQKDSMNGDLRVTKTIIPQTFCATRYAGNIYTEMGPVIGQYTDPHNISNPKLNIYGAVYNNMMNNVKNLSMMDPAKIYQMRFNNIQESIGEAIQSNIGSVLIVNKKTFDGTGGPQGFFDMLYKLKTIVSEDDDYGKEDTSRAIRSILMQSGISIPEYTSLAQYYENMMIKTLRYNPAKLGNSGQYENQANIQASLAAPDRQLGRYYDINLKVRENVMQGLTQAAMITYINNDELIENYLDERLHAHYKGNYEELLGTIFEYKVDSSVEDVNNLERYKQILINHVATGGDMEGAGEIFEAKDMQSAKEKAKAKRLYMERKEMEKRAHEQEMMDKNNASLEQRQKETLDKQYELEYEKIDASKERTYLASMNMALANDINGNNIPDQLERDDRNREMQENVHKDKMDLEYEKLKIEEQKVNNMLKKDK